MAIFLIGFYLFLSAGIIFLLVIFAFLGFQLFASGRPRGSLTPSLTIQQEAFSPQEPVQETFKAQEEAMVPPQALVAKRFVIQVASFQDKKRADVVVEELNKKGDAPMIETKDLGEKGIWYRVYVGGFETKDQAQGLLDIVKKDYPGSFIKQL